MVTTSCVLNAPRCVTTVPRVHLHGSPGGVFVGHRPPRDPGDPPHIYIYIQKVIEVLHLYRCVTHTHPAFGRVVRRKMRWRWRWGGSEGEVTLKMRWKITWPGREEGNAKEEGENTNTTHLARSGQTLERQGKRKAEGRRTRNKTSGGGGRTKAPEPTWHSENLHTPKHATEPTYLGREERMR